MTRFINNNDRKSVILYINSLEESIKNQTIQTLNQPIENLTIDQLKLKCALLGYDLQKEIDFTEFSDDHIKYEDLINKSNTIDIGKFISSYYSSILNKNKKDTTTIINSLGRYGIITVDILLSSLKKPNFFCRIRGLGTKYKNLILEIVKDYCNQNNIKFPYNTYIQ